MDCSRGLVEGLGQLARWTLTGGQAHDRMHAQGLIEGIDTRAVIADRAFDADALIARITDGGAKSRHPPKVTRRLQRDFDRHQYRHRNLIERLFCRIKQFRGIATRFNKLASRFSAFIALAATFSWLA